MKTLRIVPTAVIVSAVLAAFAVVGLAGASSSGSYPVGDLNCDSSVTADDTVIVLQSISDLDHDSCVSEQSVVDPFDLNCAGGVTGSDALLPLLYEAGLSADNGPECPDIGSMPGGTGTPTGTPDGSGTPTVTPTATPGGGSTTPTTTPTETPGGSETPTPTGTPSPTSTASPSPTPIPTYTLTEIVPVIPGTPSNRGLGIYPIPGAADEALMLMQHGLIYRVSVSGAFTPTIWGNLTGLVTTQTNSEEGLLSLAFSPDYETSRRVYIYYNRPPSPGNYRYGDVLSRFEVDGGALDMDSEERLIDLDDRGYYHNGGGIGFGLDGYLYLGIGDEGHYNFPPEPQTWLWANAQDLTTLFGKVIRIDVSGETGYAIPDDNPFHDEDGPNKDEIYAMGFRNPHRLSFDSETGDLWLGDVGYTKREEVNLVEAGKNYGWPWHEGTLRGPWNCEEDNPEPCDPADYTPPFFEYCQRISCPPSGDCAVVGGYVYHGAEMPELQGWYIFADWCAGDIRAFDPAGPAGTLKTLVQASDPEVLGPPWTWLPSLGLLADGEIAVVMRDTHQTNATTRVFRLEHE
jgi:glucose/arabinose dehydrogenase